MVERAGDEMTDRARGRVRYGIEEPEVEPERDPGETEHASELAATEHRDRRHMAFSSLVESGRTTRWRRRRV